MDDATAQNTFYELYLYVYNYLVCKHVYKERSFYN